MRLRISARRDLVCQQAVELVTDYLEEALSWRIGDASNGTSPGVRIAPNIWLSCGRLSRSLAGSRRTT